MAATRFHGRSWIPACKMAGIAGNFMRVWNAVHLDAWRYMEEKMKVMSCLRTGKKKWVFPALFLLSTLGGCIVSYEQPGKTAADFARDKKYCESVAEKEYVRKGTRVCDEVDACLISKGWKSSR